MSTMSRLSQLSSLSQAAYSFITLLDIQSVRTAALNQNVLKGDVLGSAQADQVFNDDRIIAIHHLPNDASGFSSTLLKDVRASEYILSIRGSEGTLLDFFPTSGADPDRYQANADIILPARGIARDQLVSLFNYYRRLITPASQEVSLYRLVDTATRPESGSYYTYESRISELLPPTTRYVHLVFEHSEIEGAKRFG